MSATASRRFHQWNLCERITRDFFFKSYAVIDASILPPHIVYEVFENPIDVEDELFVYLPPTFDSRSKMKTAARRCTFIGDFMYDVNRIRYLSSAKLALADQDRLLCYYVQLICTYHEEVKSHVHRYLDFVKMVPCIPGTATITDMASCFPAVNYTHLYWLQENKRQREARKSLHLSLAPTRRRSDRLAVLPRKSYFKYF